MLLSIGMAVENFLVSKGIEESKNIWVNHQKIEDGIAIYETGGLPPHLITGVNETYIIQIKTKYSNPSMGSKYSHEVINQIYNELRELRKVDIGGFIVNYVKPNQPPAFLEVENKRMVYVCNFTINVDL